MSIKRVIISNKTKFILFIKIYMYTNILLLVFIQTTRATFLMAKVPRSFLTNKVFGGCTQSFKIIRGKKVRQHWRSIAKISYRNCTY